MPTNESAAPEFDEFADDYNAALDKGLALSGEGKDYFAEGRLRWLRRRLDERGARPETVLDFGCGTGSATPFFFDHLGIRQVVGFDPSEKSLEVARQEWAKHAVRFSSSMNEVADSGSVDLAFCNGVFHHITPDNRAEALTSIFDILVPGNCFAFWENNPWNPVTRYAMSKVPFDRDAILVWPQEARRLLKNAGFEILLTDYVFFFPRSLAFMRSLEPGLRWLPLGGQYLVLARKP